jgi:hypothetical protein
LPSQHYRPQRKFPCIERRGDGEQGQSTGEERPWEVLRRRDLRQLRQLPNLTVAPAIFGEADLKAYVAKQPESEAEEDLAKLALLQCPLGSIGVHPSGGIDQARILQRFPEPVEDEVYWLGYSSPKALGGKSYIIQHPDGNWMVDGPTFHPDLVHRIEERGGLKIHLPHPPGPRRRRRSVCASFRCEAHHP